jgi:hypothetical protein
MRALTLLALLGCALVLSPPSTRGADWDAGIRGIILAGDAPPANDMPGAGLLVRRTWKDHWVFGAGLEQYSFDYEEPYNVVGIGLDPSFGEEAIDGTTDSTVVSAWIERRYNDAAAGGWSWFWTAGIGYAFISVDESITGPAAGGGTFDIVTQAGDELHLLASGGARYSFGAWFIDAAIHAQHQFTDYDVMDRVSGATGEIGAQTLLGASLGLSYRF